MGDLIPTRGYRERKTNFRDPDQPYVSRLLREAIEHQDDPWWRYSEEDVALGLRTAYFTFTQLEEFGELEFDALEDYLEDDIDRDYTPRRAILHECREWAGSEPLSYLQLMDKFRTPEPDPEPEGEPTHYQFNGFEVRPAPTSFEEVLEDIVERAKQHISE